MTGHARPIPCAVLALVCCAACSEDATGPVDTSLDMAVDPGTDPGSGGEIIPPGRRTLWQPGVPGGIPSVDVVCPAGAPSVLDHGAAGDGETDDSGAFASAVDAAEEGDAILVPEGTYLIESTIGIGKSVVLCGEGADRSRLVFDTDSYGIEIVTYQRGDFVDVESGLVRWSTEIEVADAGGFTPGQYAELQQDNDWALMDPENEWRDASWVPEASVGQMFRVVAVEGDVLSVEPPVHLDYNMARDPVIRPMGLVSGAGLQGLHLSRLEGRDASTVLMKNAVGCWMRDCVSEMTTKSHVGLSSALWCEVRGSVFIDAWDHGGGGHGYGASLSHHVTDSLVENNVFEHLRHSMIIQDGASGNVYGYNFSTDAHQSEGGDWTPCDISLHGHYPHMNLFEGNVVEEVDVSDYWGPCGPGNTFFRNRVVNEGIEVMDHSHYQNVVGNEVLDGDVSWDETVTETLVHGNLVGGEISWDPGIDARSLPDSLYLEAKPSFFGDTVWPVTGSDVAGAGTIPAEDRWHDL